MSKMQRGCKIYIDNIKREESFKRFGMEVRLKNYTDVLIFQLRVCAGATNSKLQSQI